MLSSVSSNSQFPIDNLPYGIFSSRDNETKHACTAIGDHIIDLAVLESNGVFTEIWSTEKGVFAQTSLNTFAALPKSERRQIREKLTELLSDELSTLHTDATLREKAIFLLEEVTLHVPVDCPEFTDYSCYEEHMLNAATMTGTKVPLSFYSFPPAYNGRTSSIVSSRTNIRRPKGVFLNHDGKPEYQSSAKLDYELEMGVIVSQPVPWGKTVSADDALNDNVFGYVLINDWSARDVQGFEMAPLGPFHGKSFATSMGSWIVVPEALEHAKARPIHKSPAHVPKHLQHQNFDGTISDIDITCSIQRSGGSLTEVSKTNFAHSHFSVGQMLAHRAASGCGLRTGEVIAGGTMSSPESLRCDPKLSHKGCLWELTENGKVEVPLAGGGFLQDGDTVVFGASARAANGRRIGFGEIITKILPAA